MYIEMDSLFEVSDLFKSYEFDFQNSTSVIKSFLRRAKERKISNLSEEEMGKIRNEIQKANQSLRQMETEIPSLPTSLQRTISPKINDYRVLYEDLRRQFVKCDDSFKIYTEKNRLFDDDRKEDAKNAKYDKNSNTSTKDKLIKTGNSIKKQGEGLLEANRTANETERVVISVQNELKKNKETLQRSLKTSKDTAGDLKTSERVLVQMRRKTLTNKLILVFIVILLALIIVILIYVKIRRLFTF